MKKKLLFGLLTLPLAFTMSANAEKINSEYIHYDYDLGVTKIQHVNQGFTHQYLDIYGLTDEKLSESNTTYWLYSTKKGEDVVFKQTGSGTYAIKDTDINLLNTDDVYPYYYTMISKSNAGRSESTGVPFISAIQGARWFFDESYNNFYVIKEVMDTNTYNKSYYISPSISASRDTFEHNNKYDFIIKGSNADTSDKTSNVYTYMPYDNTGLQGHVKVGRLTDTSILSKFANNDSEAYNSLLNYAKNNDGNVFNFTLSKNKSFDATSMIFEDGDLYYVYIYYDNDGSLLDYSDVIIAKADNGFLSLFNDYGDYRVGETSSNTTTPKNPKTGVEDMIYLVPVVLLGGFATVALTRRKTSFR